MAMIEFTAKRAGFARVGHARGALALLAALALLPAAGCAPLPAVVRPVSIVVGCEPFAGVETAARSEERVNWWDSDRRDDDACTESFAALELRRHLGRALGIPESSIALQRAPSLPAEGDVFVLGSRRSNPLVARLTGRAAAAPGGSPDGFSLRALRRGKRSIFLIEGNSRTGTLYGVYEFLALLGVRFYGLGDTGITYPAAPPPLPRHLRLTSSPAFLTRGFWAWEPRGNPDFFLWMARNRMNLWTAAEEHPAFLEKLGIRLTGGGHSLQADYLNPAAQDPHEHDRRSSYFEAHPEWFGLHAGQRSDRITGESGDNFCTSNADAVHEFATNLIRSLADGPLRHADVVNLWPLDGGRWCECARCQAIGGPTDRLLDLVARVSAELRAARRDGRLARDVELSAAAYLETLAAPTRPLPADFDTTRCSVTFFPYLRCYAHALGDPTCTEINTRIAARFESWTAAPERAYHGPLGVGEYYNVSYFKSLPLVFPHVMAADIRWYFENGVRRFHSMHAPTRLWGPWTLDHAVLARLLWNPAADVDTLLAEFRRRYYPTTFEQVAAFDAALERASANILAIEGTFGAFGYSGAPAGRLTLSSAPLFPLRHLTYVERHGPPNDAPTWLETLAAVREARAALDAALAACRDPLERARLKDDERRFAYGEATFALYDHLLRLVAHDRAADRAGAARELALADSAASRLRAMRDVVQVAASHANARDGLDASHVEPTLAYFHARYRTGGGR
jgi:hypothetical protein